MMLRACLVLGVLLGGVPTLVGCAGRARATNTVAIPAGSYAAAFDATREVLRDERFQLDRVDAQLGVITTRPKRAKGLAAAWEREQSSFADEVEDFVHRQQRSVRVQFVDAAEVEAPEPTPARKTGDAVAIVEVDVERVMMPGQRPQPRALGLTNYTFDPALAARGVGPGLPVSVRQDDALARRLAAKIEARLRAASPTTPAP